MLDEVRDNWDKLLLVFVHGFRGSDASFQDFPNRLQAILTNTLRLDVEVDIYPSYKTAGELLMAVNNFSSWLCQKVSKIEAEVSRLNSRSKIMIVLLGHSMGGIVAAETILRFAEPEHTNELLGAKIIGMLAYDTPFYSINHHLVTDHAKDGLERFSRIGQFCGLGATALISTTGSRAIQISKRAGGSLGPWGLVVGAVGAVAVGTVAYMARDKISETIIGVYDEYTFIKDLTDMHGCDERVRKVLDVPNTFFKCFYVLLPMKENENDRVRPKTFIKLPPKKTSRAFIPILSSAPNVIKAHTGMFDPQETRGYYQLGSDSVTLISDMVSKFQQN
ncbi:hypothetical protein G6F46_009329 [Rhizopus delemar]|uniref:DUF676 domain-containing protein n=2 Tax=Rhizopus TaxID=4842 RepID=A0A9P6YVF1_9FUNG|nr:hypothetical protein G6F55_001626 [Rhizopus delemar]KAG1538922.1 hypothetical protein G6F51_009464 [Rhizopus arrhizus]KAG1493118.1 hypothetical protein G6F54_008812 [Rhizopus delemar]KAG1511592.1 hypothetical protein G6F53_005821 [Rhizopus delemar]KAG1520389.1 hypothetical protein G6F52_007710 [Rhizopus delemar]